ncbi:MAG: sugar transferase [Kiritimatiellia bacterium]|jgi:sugar transferase EpsL
MKRFFDLATVIATAPLWLPALAIVALAVRRRMGEPVLFRQPRAGLHGRVFTILKFRTMLAGDAPDAERITPFGRTLRHTSLDELPQLLNVLRGDMSLVGPRPLLVDYLPLYSPEQARRHEVRPGITGWAQVNGRNAVSWEEKFALDTWYVDHRSLWLDLRILFRTVWNVLARRGVATAAAETPPPFQGTR